MLRFKVFFENMSDEEWEHFSVHVLRATGYVPYTLPAYGVDGGKDYLVQKDDKMYLVSCKHYIKSGKHVGQDDEENIGDRLLQHNANGFIGFYSTGITTGLQNRLNGICNNSGYVYFVFEPHNITCVMQYMDTRILQSFGLYPGKYYMNMSEQEYQPLPCVCCGKDILTDKNIPNSIAGIAKYKDGKYGFVYGCKSCLRNVELYLNGYLEVEQALHVKWIQDWEQTIDEFIQEDNLELRSDFYEMRCRFLKGIRQRQLPQTEGTWYGL